MVQAYLITQKDMHLKIQHSHVQFRPSIQVHYFSSTHNNDNINNNCNRQLIVVNLGFPSISSILIPYSLISIRLVEITNMNSMICGLMQMSCKQILMINTKKKKKKLLIHRTMITKDWEWTMISLAQQIHRSHIIGNQDHQKKSRETERNNILCEKTMHRM